MDQRVNILLVDDQPAKLLSYEVVLKDLGENLIKASSASEAFAQLLRHDIAVLLIDVVMPELDGFELAKMIRSHPRFERTAILFVSAFALTDFDRLKGYEHGAVDYIPVPVVPDILRAKVRVFAELYRKTRQLEDLNVELERRVQSRTAELAQANAELERRVEERTREREVALAQVHEMQKLESLGRHRPRLQQPADGDPGKSRFALEPDPAQCRGHATGRWRDQGSRAGRLLDQADARLRPPAGIEPRARRRRRLGRGHGRDAPALARSHHRDRHRLPERSGAGAHRPQPARAGRAEPRAEQPGRDGPGRPADARRPSREGRVQHARPRRRRLHLHQGERHRLRRPPSGAPPSRFSRPRASARARGSVSRSSTDWRGNRAAGFGSRANSARARRSSSGFRWRPAWKPARPTPGLSDPRSPSAGCAFSWWTTTRSSARAPRRC